MRTAGLLFIIVTGNCLISLCWHTRLGIPRWHVVPAGSQVPLSSLGQVQQQGTAHPSAGERVGRDRRADQRLIPRRVAAVPRQQHPAAAQGARAPAPQVHRAELPGHQLPGHHSGPTW